MSANLRHGMSCPTAAAAISSKSQATTVGARYVKEVDAFEATMKFYQEIYDHLGRLIEIHEKYPIDKGHIRASGA